MYRDDLTYIQHMRDAARKAVDFVAGQTRSSLDSDEMLSLALVRLLEVLGEASRNVDQLTKSSFPDIPWRQIAAVRNRLIHGYFDVDLDIVWTIVTTDLPYLIPQLEAILESSSSTDDPERSSSA